MVQALYGSRSTLFQRESLGLISDESNVVFPPACVTALFSATRIHVEENSLESIFVSIDPSGGGPSEFALVSVTTIGQKFVVSIINLQKHTLSPLCPIQSTGSNTTPAKAYSSQCHTFALATLLHAQYYQYWCPTLSLLYSLR